MRDTVAPYLAQWRQYVYRLSVTLLARARDTAAQRAAPVELAELRRSAEPDRAGPARERAGPPRAAAEVSASVRRRVPGHRSGPGGDRVPARGRRRPVARVRTADASTGAALPLRPGALFVVGDPKQSIYRFRRADIDIYNIVRERFSDPAIGRVLPLTMNFRSVPALVRLGERGLQDAVSRRSRRRIRRASPRSIRRRRRARPAASSR